MANEALTVKSQSLFLYHLYQKSTHWSFHFVFGIIKLSNIRRLRYENKF